MEKRSIQPGTARWHDAAYWGLMSALGVVFLVLNQWTSFKEDDMEFSLLRDAGILDFVKAQYDHFMTSNGRCADFFATLFCAFLGKQAFNVCNTLVLILMAHLVCLLSTGRRSIVALSLFAACVGLFFPVPGQTMLFVAGSCNYLWAITASLLLVHLLGQLQGRRLGTGKTLLLMALAFIAGNFNEATSFGFWGGMVLYYAINRRELNRNIMLALAAYLLGLVVIAASPGAWNRVAGGGIAVNMSLSDLLISRGYIFAKMMVRFVVPILAVLVGLATLTFKGMRPVKQCPWGYILVAMAFLMLVLGYLYERAYAPLATVSFIIVAMALEWLLSQWRHQVAARVLLVAMGITASAVAYHTELGTLHELKAFEDNIAQEIKAAPRHAVLHEYQFNKSGRFITPLRYISTDFFNREATYCAFYDKDNVQFVNDSIYNRYHSGRLLDGAVKLPLVSDRPEIADSILEVPGQDYMVIVLNVDTLLPTPQLATYYLKAPGAGLNEDEKRFRNRNGLADDFEPQGFFPLYYQGRQLLIAPPMGDHIAQAVFQLDYDGTLGLMTLKREKTRKKK